MKKWLLPIIGVCVAAGFAYWLLRRPFTPADESETPTGLTAPAVAPGGTFAPLSTSPGSRSNPASAGASNLLASSSPPLSTASATVARVVPAPGVSSIPVPVEAPSGIPPAILLENMRTTMRQYGLTFGGNPVGTNPEITKTLNGDNPKQVKFLGSDGNRINEKGELVDAWGTPYFFHQLSAMEMEIRSAGPDRIMWTPDDLVIK